MLMHRNLGRVPAREQGRASSTRPVYVLLGIAASIGWAYVLLASDAFLINQVDAKGLRALDPIDVSREVFSVLDGREGWRPWPARHTWFIDQAALSEALKTRLFAANVVVDKSSTHILRLKIEERSNRLIFHSRQQYFWVDLQGTASAELSLEERRQAQARILGSRESFSDEPPLIHADLSEPIAEGYRVVDSSQVKLWITLTDDMTKAGLAYREFEPPMDASTSLAIIKSAEGYPIYTDIADPIEPQLKSYLSFKKNQPANVKVTEYVDVRIPGRIYVK